MSYCEIITFKDGKPDQSAEFRNAWGGAARIWTALYDRYLKDPNKLYDSWLGSASTGKTDLWDLAKRKDLPRFMRAVHVATFDRAIVRREHYQQLAADLREFAKTFPPDGVCHLMAWADLIEKIDADAIGFYGTSCSEYLWAKPNPDDKDGDTIPYNLNEDDKHFEVYDWLEEHDAEPVTVPQ